ncbi:Chromatin modification-related protein EAF7 [Macrophomina phaseolina MS6]|uniref:Chromatin modification-related protein EAF7 n=1 Tax=Macrophomina phaseolina (strain MS6) TaxID=1126212 RepID=K2RHR9_MACPH|nr:Chromatin modification-related protein EAF7 [Macrophomina phaseolina MS6]
MPTEQQVRCSSCPALPTLPEEMIDLIISFADHGTQQQLRLCSKQFCRLATPRYFRQFRIRLSQLSLDGLIMIANHPVFSKYVQILEYNIEQLLWFFDFNHFLQGLHLQPNQPWYPPPGLKHIPTQSFTLADLHQIYTHYASERDISAHYLSLLLSSPADLPANPLRHTYTHLPRALALLPNLHTIATSAAAAPATWRNLLFDPASSRHLTTSTRTEHTSILLHALGGAASLLQHHARTLPLRTLTLPSVDATLFGGDALAQLWSVNAPENTFRPDEGEEDWREEGEAFYESQYRLLTHAVTHLTTLDLRIGALARVRELLELEELEMVWLQQDVAFGGSGCGEIFVPVEIFAGSLEEEERLQMPYLHYEAQVVDFMLRKSDVGPVYDQDEFLKNHSEDCEWCAARISERNTIEYKTAL